MPLLDWGPPHEVSLALPADALLVRPSSPVRVGVLVLLGSHDQMNVERARLLARHGAHALSLRWFGGDGQPPGVCEIPLENFVRALDRLSEEPVDGIAVIGLSKGAEAALLLACVDDRVDLTVAMSPPSVVWANVGPGLDGQTTPYRSSWTWRGEQLPFVAYDDDWVPAEDDGPIAYRTLYEQSLLLDPDATRAAAIPIEEAEGDLVLVAGHDDELWPSVSSVRALAARRVSNDRQVEVIINERAGHHPVLPGQSVPPSSPHLRRGGTAESDGELGAAIWAVITQRLGLNGASYAIRKRRR
ncbi:MAG: acyl-CoA thioesterase [Propionibacteriales bacterium]|nr:acyl-CoA thioesterase [Propionibacteriales bacterium]